MLRQLQDMAGVFAKVAEDEDKRLNELCGEGIFFMPEMAFAYACGKAVMSEKVRIFGKTTVEWIREQDIGSGGPSDLVIGLPGGKRIVVEFKIKDKISAYLNDINKLNKLGPTSHARVFCALVDFFTEKKPDDRIDKFEPRAAEITNLVPLCTPFHSFVTRKTRYKGKISCVIKVWSVGDPPNFPVL